MYESVEDLVVETIDGVLNRSFSILLEEKRYLFLNQISTLTKDEIAILMTNYIMNRDIKNMFHELLEKKMNILGSLFQKEGNNSRTIDITNSKVCKDAHQLLDQKLSLSISRLIHKLLENSYNI